MDGKWLMFIVRADSLKLKQANFLVNALNDQARRHCILLLQCLFKGQRGHIFMVTIFGGMRLKALYSLTTFFV